MEPEVLKELIADGGLTVRANGDCMTGAFPNGAMLLIKRNAVYLPGDVVVYARGDSTLVSHRLLGYLPGPYGWRTLTRADNTRNADAPVALSRVLGRVVQTDGVPLKCTLRVRAVACLAYFPAVVGWLKQRAKKGDV